MPYRVLATLSDGEKGILTALKTTGQRAPHQRCQAHFLNNLAEPVLGYDTQLRQALRTAVGEIPSPLEKHNAEQTAATPPF